MGSAAQASGRTVLITGATDGLGRALALHLARQGWTVLAHGRDPAKGAALIAELERAGAPAARFYQADFASLAEVGDMARRVLQEESTLHVLVNNAGIGVMVDREVSRDGHELVFQVNYLAGYLLSRMLTPLLVRSAPARIVNIASAGQFPLNLEDLMLTQRWHGLIAYGRSKLAQILMTLSLAQELESSGVTVNALHPASLMDTKLTASLRTMKPTGLIGRFMLWRMKPRDTLGEGVANAARLVSDPALASVTGRYFQGAREKRAHKQAYDGGLRSALEASSRALCQHELAHAPSP
jgi:NAD(P)-dependent dehydrogenase (short-subunit alcohol dehydrogenase family)